MSPRLRLFFPSLLLLIFGAFAGCGALVGPSIEAVKPDAQPAADAGPVDAPPDLTPDRPDAPVDLPADQRTDVSRDSAPDAAPDRAPDLAPDLAPDAPADLAPDAPRPDVAPDVITCPATQTLCDGRCVTTATDPDNCGGCDKPCGSGLCAASTCQLPSAGHLVVIGHDYAATVTGLENLVGNAALLSSRSPTRILAFEGQASVGAIQSVNAAINKVATARHRALLTKTVPGDQVAAQLPDNDVFLIYAQSSADDATLDQLSTAWANALVAFIASGKTVVLLDGFSASNTGTLRVLKGSGLFAGSVRTAATGQTMTVVSPTDPVARNLPATYTAPTSSATFQTQETVKVVQTPTAGPVVVHRVF